MILPPLGMTDDHCLCTGIRQHFCTYVTGEGASDFCTTILSANHHSGAADFNGARDKCSWRAYENLTIGRPCSKSRREFRDFAQRRRQTIHLPVSSDQLPHSVPLQSAHRPKRAHFHSPPPWQEPF